MGSIPNRYVVFDTETYEKLHNKEPRHVSLHFRLGVAKVTVNPLAVDPSVDYLDFDRVEQFFDFLDSLPREKEKTWIFAHNLGFDIRIIGLFGEVSKGRYSLLNPDPPKKTRSQETPFIVLDDPPTIIRLFRRDGQEFLWCDTWQWLSSSLAKIGKILGNAKGVMPSMDDDLSLWFEYCRQDVDVLDDAMRRIFQWLHVNGWHHFHPTRAGQSMLIYNKTYSKKRIKVHNDPETQKLERPSYFGGFTECFRVGSISGPIHQVDVNSLYPYVMSDKWYPSELLQVSLDGSDNTKVVSKSPSNCIAEVYLNSKENSYPLRTREGTIFVRGRVRTVLSGPELDAAFRAGDVSLVTRYARYRMEPLFKEFVHDIYAYRLHAKRSGNEIFDYCYKLMLNSLYGKFGQMTSEWVYSGETDAQEVYDQGYTIDSETGDVRESRVIAGTTYHREEPYDHPKSFVPIASFVTGYAREYMRSLRNLVGEGEYFYQATDSLYITDQGLSILKSHNLIDPDTLGSLKHEATYQHLRIRNIHNIDKDDKKVRGSIRGKAVEVQPDVYLQESWESLLPGIKAKHHNEVHIKNIIKRLTARYVRRRVDSGGWTEPHRIDNHHLTPEESANTWLLRSGLLIE